MRYCIIICLALFFGCRKEPAAVEVTKCNLASITRYGYAVFPLKYNGTKIVKVGDDSSSDAVLTYGNTDWLTTIELPSKDPVYKTELFYNDEEKVFMEKNYEKSGYNWVENTVFFFTYTNGKVTAIRERVRWASPALEYGHEVIWDGDNIHSIITRSGATAICTQQYSYDTTRKNPVTAFTDLYYGDNLRARFGRYVQQNFFNQRLFRSGHYKISCLQQYLHVSDQAIRSVIYKSYFTNGK